MTARRSRKPSSLATGLATGSRLRPIIKGCDTRVHVAGDVSDKNLDAIQHAVAHSQEAIMSHLQRNLPDMLQTSDGFYRSCWFVNLWHRCAILAFRRSARR